MGDAAPKRRSRVPDEAVRRVLAGEQTAAVAREYGLPRTTLTSAVDRARQGRTSTAVASTGETPRVSISGDEGEAVSRVYPETAADTLTHDDLLRGWKLDPNEWEIIDGTVTVNRWMVSAADPDTGEFVEHWNYQYKARVRRRRAADELPAGLRPGADWHVVIRGRPRSNKPRQHDLEHAGVFFPDPQFGYWWDERNELRTIHDERCFDIRNQVMLDLRAEYGRISKVVCAGDTNDNAWASRFLSLPNYVERTLQPALDRTTREYAELRAICPDDDEEIVFIDGNHDNPRLINVLLSKGLGQLVGIRRGLTAPDEPPVLSIQHLTRTADYRIRYVEPFPTATAEFNSNLGVAHGPAYSSKKMGTPQAILASTRRSMLHGHTHREEWMAVTLWVEGRPRTYYVGSPGTFCRTDLVVPSHKSKGTSRGVPAVGQGTEDWQQGFFIVLYNTDGPAHFDTEHVRIWNGRADEPSVAYWRGKRYVSRVDADGNPL